MSGIASSVLAGGDDVDFFVSSGDLSPEAEMIMRRVGSRYHEADEAEGAAAKHTFKGRVEILSNRIVGLGDFIDSGQFTPAVTALEKIIVDMSSFHKDLSRASGKKVTNPKKSIEQKPPDTDNDAEPQGNAGAIKAQRKSEEPVYANPKSARQAAQPGVQSPGMAPQEHVYVVNGEAITEALGSDPFGLGAAVIEEVRRLSGLTPKRKQRGKKR